MSDDPYEQERLRLQRFEFEDLRRARALASNFANRAHVRVQHDLTRITFGEQVVPGLDPTAWTFAVTLSTENALSIANLIYEQYNALYPDEPSSVATPDLFETIIDRDNNG